MDRSTFHPEQLLQAVSAVADGAGSAAKRHIQRTFGHQLLRRDAALALPADMPPAHGAAGRRRDGVHVSGAVIVPNTGETIPQVEQ